MIWSAVMPAWTARWTEDLVTFAVMRLGWRERRLVKRARREVCSGEEV